MDSGTVNEFDFITRPAELKRLVEILGRQRLVAVDTESNSLYVYREQVCLIQFSTAQADYLVDPLAIKDLSPLGPVFNNPNIEKVFHAAEYDLICLRRDYGFNFANLFDTMVAARILGRTEVGLGSMLEAELGIALDKRHQRADWGQRPLPRELLEYAHLDTHYLIQLHDRLEAELVQRSLLPLAREDFNRSCQVKIDPEEFAPAEDRPIDCWRVSGSYDLDPQQAAVLLELCRYRDQVARSINRPLFKVINDQTLIAIAIQAPQNLKDLSQLPGMSPVQVRRHGAGLLQAVQRGLSAKPIRPPRSPRPDDSFLERLEGLRNWRKKTALELEVASDVVLPKDVMFTLASHNPGCLTDLAEVMVDIPWRYEHFGDQIFDVLSKKVKK